MSVPDVPNNATVPHAHRVAHLRRVLVNAVSEDDIAAVVQKLIEAAKGGDLVAIRLLLQYTLGKPTSGVPASDLPADLPHPSAPDPLLDPVDEWLPAGSKADDDPGAVVRRHLAEERRQGADTKRRKPSATEPIRVRSGQALARPETMRLVNLP